MVTLYYYRRVRGGGRRRAIIACLMTGSHIRSPKTQTKRYWKIITTRIIETGERRALRAERSSFPGARDRDSREAAVAISKCNAVRCTSRRDPRNDARADVRRDSSARCYIIIIRVPPRYNNGCTNSALDILLLVSLPRVLFSSSDGPQSVPNAKLHHTIILYRRRAVRL